MPKLIGAVPIVHGWGLCPWSQRTRGARPNSSTRRLRLPSAHVCTETIGSSTGAAITDLTEVARVPSARGATAEDTGGRSRLTGHYVQSVVEGAMLSELNSPGADSPRRISSSGVMAMMV